MCNLQLPKCFSTDVCLTCVCCLAQVLFLMFVAQVTLPCAWYMLLALLFLRAVDLLTVYVLSSDGDYFARRASVAQICCIRCVAARVCWQLDH